MNGDSRADRSRARSHDALPDLSVGAKIRDQSDFISPERIESRCYTEAAFPKLQKDTDQMLKNGRNSSGVDIDSEYCRMALRRLDSESGPLFAQAAIEYRTAADLLAPATVPAVADAPARRPAHRRRTRRGIDEHGTK